MRTSQSSSCMAFMETTHLTESRAHCELVMSCSVRKQQETNTGWSLCFICSCRGSNELLFSGCNERQSATKLFKAFPPNMHEMNISCFTRRAGGERRGFMELQMAKWAFFFFLVLWDHLKHIPHLPILLLYFELQPDRNSLERSEFITAFSAEGQCSLALLFFSQDAELVERNETGGRIRVNLGDQKLSGHLYLKKNKLSSPLSFTGENRADSLCCWYN